MSDPISEAMVRKAPGCPHYVSSGYYAEMLAALGREAEAAIRCARCCEQPVGPLGAVRSNVAELRRQGRAVLDARERWLRRNVA